MLFRSIAHIGALIFGLMLIFVGATALIYAAYTATDLYLHPDGVITIIHSFQRIIPEEAGAKGLDMKLLWYMSWPIVILLLLLQGKIGIWAVQAGARLIEIVPHEEQ